MPIKVAASPMVFDRVSIVSADGWVPLATEPTVLTGMLDISSNTISFRTVGDSGSGTTYRTNQMYPIDNVDISKIEVSTSSGVNVTVSIWGYVAH